MHLVSPSQVRSALGPAVLFCLLTAPTMAQLVLGTQDGAFPNEGFGTSLASISGPGIRWIAVGAPRRPVLAGSGLVATFSWAPATRWSPVPAWQQFGTNSSAFGQTMVGTSDIDGDGVSDVLIGSPTESVASNATGRIRVLSGANGFQLRAFDQGNMNWRMGDTVIAPGQVYGTAAPDFIGGVPTIMLDFCGGSALCGSNPGRLNSTGGFILYDGAAITPQPLQFISGRRTVCNGPCYDDMLARSGCAFMDADNDGRNEFLVGAYNGGGLRIFGWDATSGALAQKWAVTNGAADFGSSVCALADLNQDLVPEIAVGAAQSGQVLVFDGALILSGPPAPTAVPPLAQISWSRVSGTNTAGGRFGHVVVDGGDLDGDGLADLLVGAPEAYGFGSVPSGAGAGQVLAFSGSSIRDGAPRLIGYLQGDRPSDYFGWAVSSVPDLTGDGRPEFAIGAPGVDTANGTDVGRVFLGTFAPQCWHSQVLPGMGCSSGGVAAELPLVNNPNGAPFVGHAEYSIGVANVGSGVITLLGIGVGLQPSPVFVPGPGPLPGPPCAIWISVQQTYNQVSNGGPPGTPLGGDRVHLPVPTTAGLAGVNLFQQWYVFNPSFPGVMSSVLQTQIRSTRP